MTWEEYKYHFVRGWEKELYKNSGCCAPVLIILATAVILLVSCRSIQYVPVETVRTEYKTKTDTFIQKDSVYVKDSVFVQLKGDTVWVERWRTRYAVKESQRTVRDTIIKTDSVQVPYPVERKLTKWESFCIDYGKLMVGATGTAILAIGVMLVLWIRKQRPKV